MTPSADIIDFAARPDRIAPAALGAAPAAPRTSATVLDVDRWGHRRAGDIAARWSETDGMPAADQATIADAHAALFDIEPQPAARPQDAQRAAWWRQMMDTPEYRALHAQTCLDPDLSELGAAALCRQWLEYAAAQPEPKPGPDGQPAPEPGSDDEPIGQTMARIRSTAQALRAAAQDVQDARDMRAGLGAGDGAELDPAAFREHFRRVRNDRTLRAIMQMAGRMRALAQALQRAKVRHGADEIAGIEPTGDLARLLPSELAQLACGIDEIELLALHRLAQRQSLGRQLHARVKVGRGPIVVCVDESGSMTGDRIIAAKALACALAWLAHHQRRWIALVAYSGDATARAYVAAPGRTDPAALIDWLSRQMGGGTTLDVIADTLPTTLWPAWRAAGMPAGKTDLIVITDDEIHAPDEQVQRLLDWRRAEQVRAYGIAIGTRTVGVLGRICDRTWSVPSLDLDSIAVSEALSI